MNKKSARKRRKRELPEHLRPLAALVALTNLIDDQDVKRIRNAEQRLNEALAETIGRAPSRIDRTSKSQASLKEMMQTASDEMSLILKNFSARAGAPEHRYGIATLLEQMRLAEYVVRDRVNFFNLFNTIATVRSALRAVALLPLQDAPIPLPEECYKPPAFLQGVNGRIKVTVVPVSHWLLSLLDGLEVGRLGVCGACGNLYVARRCDQLGCSRQCGDTLYMRRYRNAEYRNRNKSDSKRSQMRRAVNELKRKTVEAKTKGGAQS